MTPNEIALRDAIARAKSLTGEAQAKAVAELESIKADITAERELRAEFSNAGSFAGAVPTLSGAIKAAGIDAMAGKGGVIDVRAVLGLKADIIASEATAAPISVSGVAPLGQDSRRVYPTLNTELISYAGVPTRIDYLRQSTRTYPTAGDATLALDHATAKPTTDLVVVEAQAATKVFGTVSSSQPNALLGHSGLEAIIRSELVNVLRTDVEKHVVDTMLADANNITAAQGTDTVSDAIYKAANDLVDGGYSASFIAMNPADAESLYLEKDAMDHYLRVPGSPLFGVPVIQSSRVAVNTVMIADRTAAKLYASGVAIAFDPYTEFSKNRTFVRAELYGVATVSQGFGICELTLN